MANIKLTIAYDGSNYLGWQRQPAHHGISIQQKLEQALADLLQQPVTIHGAGRTDAGVHALGQVANFYCSKPLPIEKLPLVVNRLLPADIRIVAAEAVAESFHARFSSHIKRYRYVIEQGRRCSPFARDYSWQIESAVDIAAMQRASRVLLGKHDFRHFTLSKATVKDFVRELTEMEIYTVPQSGEDTPFPWQQLIDPLVIDVSGNGFLYKMVRLIVCRLLAVGQGKLPEEAIADFLSGSFWRNVPPAPPQGLFLQRISYQ
jgi:tRNA pseudouridine38-40 synthase